MSILIRNGRGKGTFSQKAKENIVSCRDAHSFVMATNASQGSGELVIRGKIIKFSTNAPESDEPKATAK